MQNGQAYIDFFKQINGTGSEEMEDTIWHKFVKENDSDLSMFMSKLTKYNGIEALKSKLDEFDIPSEASFNVAEALYIATNENEYLRLIIENYNTTSNQSTKISYVARLSRMAKAKEVYDKLIDIYINDEKDANQFIAILGILFADGYLRDIDDLDEVTQNMKLIRLFLKDCKEDRNVVLADYIKGAFEGYRKI